MQDLENRKMLERQIIAWLITDYDGLIDYLDIPIDNTTIYYPKHKQILKAMKENWTSDPVIIASKCNNVSAEELFEMAWDCLLTTEDTFKKYVDEVKEIAEKNRLECELSLAISSIKSWRTLEQIYEQINRIKIWEDVEINDEEIALEILKEINWEQAVKIVRTWYTELDRLVWWYEDWQVIVIWARPWIWKSMFAINLANNNITAWEKVALFSLEMDKKQVFRRLVAMNSGVWVWKLKEKNEWEARERAENGVNKLLEQLDMFYCIDDIHKIDELERKIRLLARKNWVHIFYIDYLQLLKNPSIKNNPVESLTDISQRLKQLALELKITIIELSQLNRDADNSIIQKASQLRGSGSIEQDADMVWLLWKDDENSDKITVSVKKCRDGRIWDVDLKQISDIMRIVNFTKPF